MGVASLLCENVHKRNGCMKNEEAHAIWEKETQFPRELLLLPLGFK